MFLCHLIGGNLEIQEMECFPRFRCVHIDFPGKEILHATLVKYRKKPPLLEMVRTALDFDASYEDLDQSLFYSKRDSVRF